jgi:hypothetical protein
LLDKQFRFYKQNSFVPVLLAAGAALVGSIFSAAAIALDEDQAFKREEGAIFAAASVIACICWMAVVQKNVLVTKAMICSAPESISAGIGNAQSSASIWIISGFQNYLRSASQLFLRDAAIFQGWHRCN